MDEAKIIIAVMDMLESSSSEDEEFETILLEETVQKKPINHNAKKEIMKEYSDLDFKKTFKVDRSTAVYIIEEFYESKHYPIHMRHGGTLPSTAENHVLSFLWFSGNKIGIKEVAKEFGIGDTTCFRQITRVINFLNSIAPNVIKFPSNAEEMRSMANEFQQISGFPGIIGCLGNTAITTKTPVHQKKSSFTQAKSETPAICLQASCDSKGKFTNIFTESPGKTTDAEVFYLSDISQQLLHNPNKEFHVLGNKTYNLRDYFLTPYGNSELLTSEQQNFDHKLYASLVVIENSFRMLKSRFGQLSFLEFHKIEKISKFILACCVVHNICIDHEDYVDICDETIEECSSVRYTDLTENRSDLRQLGEMKRDDICRILSH